MHHVFEGLMANVAFEFNEKEDDHQDQNKQDQPCSETMALMELFSSVFGQESAASCSCEVMQQEHISKQKTSRGVVESSVLVASCGSGPREEEYLNHRLSMEEILMIAGEKFIQFSTNRIDGISVLFHPYGSSISGLCFEDERDVEIMQTLLSAAENVGLNQFHAAARLVSRCQLMLSESGTPVQRLAFYFTVALEQKISRECGQTMIHRTVTNTHHKAAAAAGLALGSNNAFLASHQQLPFGQVAQFAGMQALIEQVKGSSKIHVIDLQIRSGIQWTALMQGLADCPLQRGRRLRITAVGTIDQTYMEDTGKRLHSFADSLNLQSTDHFLFEIVYLREMEDFNEDDFKIDPDETVAVYSFMMLRSMISKPRSLESVMKTIAGMRPVVMVVSEVEANHNSPSFIDRFTESLLFYSAYFDCLEEFMERSNEYRAILEGRFFGEGIINIVAAEDEERVTRNVKVSVWRKYFARFGMMEMELSESSKYQASLVLEQFGVRKGRACNLHFDGKGLIVGWKGTPIQSLTAWKFS